MFVLFVDLVLFPIIYVSLLVWISESPPIWERAADSVYHISHWFTDFVYLAIVGCLFLGLTTL